MTRTGRPPTPPLQRLMSKIQIDPDTGCWRWQAGLSHNGYGRMKVKGLGAQAHRVAYELLRGPIPEGLCIDHLCRVRDCVNPWHLEPVTIAENLYRGETLAAQNKAKTHCAHGHPLSGENLHIDRGRRRCRTCRREANRRRHRAHS